MDTDIPGLLSELDRLANGTTERLTAAVQDVDKIIEILMQAREQVAQGLYLVQSSNLPPHLPQNRGKP